MTSIRSSLLWAAAFMLLALATRFGWIADKDATTMFAILPALWVASTRPGRCRLGKVAA